MLKTRGPRALSSDNCFALEHVHDGRLAPDGRWAVVLASAIHDDEERFELRLLALDEPAASRVIAEGCPRFPRWSPDGGAIAYLDDLTGTLVVDRAGQNLIAAAPPTGRPIGPPAWSPDGNSLVVVAQENERAAGPRRIRTRLFRAEGVGDCEDYRCTLYRYDVVAARWSDALATATTLHRPEFSPDGGKLLVLRSDAVIARPGYGGLTVALLDLATADLTVPLGADWTVSTATWADDRAIVFVGADQNQLVMPAMALWCLALASGDVALRSADLVGEFGLRMHHDMPTWETSQSHNILVAAGPDAALATISRGGSTEVWRLATTGAPRCERIVGGDRSCVVLDVDPGRDRLLFATTDLISPWDVRIGSLAGSGERPLTRWNAPRLAAWPALAVEPLGFTSADGLKIDAWYLKRADRAGPLPSILFIHGGPSLAVGHAFRFDFHLLAAAGFGVIFANFRGSAGYGPAFVNAIKGDWGARAYPDHIGAVDAAIARGLAEPGRLGVWGASHGGFAAAWIVGQTDRFRAAVVESGMTSFDTLYRLTDAPDQFARDLGGKPHEIPDVYRSRSPLAFAHRCVTPTLLLHGANDLRCPLAEAEQFYRTLHDVGCPTELEIVPDMNHMGDSTGPVAARRAQNEALLDWFERYL